MKSVLTPDGKIDPVQTALEQMRAENSCQTRSTSLGEMAKALSEETRRERASRTRWQNFKMDFGNWWNNEVYRSKENWWQFRDLFINWRKTLQHIKNIAVMLAVLFAFMFALFAIGHGIRHMVYRSWIEPDEDSADSIRFYRTHWLANDEVIYLQSKFDPDSKSKVWMRKTKDGWEPFFIFSE